MSDAIVVGVIIVLAAAYVGRKFLRSGGQGACGCSGCSEGPGCAGRAQSKQPCCPTSASKV